MPLTRRELLLATTAARAAHAQTETPDVVVYGATAGGVIAAVAAAREGLRVALLEPGRHLGGMTSGGLGYTDHGRKETIGGYALEFYRRVGARYGDEVTWYFEPHVAEIVLRQMAAEANVGVFTGHRMREDGGLRKRGGAIREIFCDNGTSFQAAVFIDATYEGDMMAHAKVGYSVGRESSAQYGETLAGVRPKDPKHQFDFAVAALDTNGNPSPDVQLAPRGEIGAGDAKVQAYNFRLCLTDNPRNRVPFPRPKTYNPARWELLIRTLQALAAHHKRPAKMDDLFGIRRLRNRSKTDVNNRGPFSTDYIGASWSYPEANYATRIRIWQNHIDYTAGLLYFLANDERVPEPLRDELSAWGLAADEFAASNHWPHQLYIREARRLRGDFVMTQRDIQTELTKHDVIGMGSYNSDSHNVQRFVQPDGSVQNEGNMEVTVSPYQIPYRVLLPKKKEASNLLVPVCVSSSHVAYSTLRMEPVFMILGHAAGAAAKMAIDNKAAVQDIDTRALTARLKAQNAVME